MSLVRPRPNWAYAISVDKSPGRELDSEFTLGNLAFNDTDSAVMIISFNSAGEVGGFTKGGNIVGQGRVIAGKADFYLSTALMEFSYATAGEVSKFTDDLSEAGSNFRISQSTVINPVPEPSTYAFFALGLGALAIVHRRKLNFRFFSP